MKYNFYIFCWIVMVISLLIHLYSCNEVEKGDPKKTSRNNYDSSSKEQEIYIDLKKVLEKETDADASIVQVKYDHYFKSPKKYKGYYINTIIDSIIKLKKFDTTNALVVFECIDGYQPISGYIKNIWKY